MEISRVREGAILVVMRAEAAMLFWQRRGWDFLARYTPNLTVSERSQVYSQMRHSAKANVDFYAYISLSSAIAILGLLLDSAAVIIGAMLVAPLMSPILAIAQGIVQGNRVMIQRAGATTFKGASVSIGVATFITALFPEMIPTEQILARTSPNLLDLGVALAAGGVGAWAVSRASGAAALPGVAIAVALVPPLCVVGYGLGTSQFWVSGGAFLLFLTNLAAIILVGALVLVLLGFRPTRGGHRCTRMDSCCPATCATDAASTRRHSRSVIAAAASTTSWKCRSKRRATSFPGAAPSVASCAPSVTSDSATSLSVNPRPPSPDWFLIPIARCSRHCCRHCR